MQKLKTKTKMTSKKRAYAYLGAIMAFLVIAVLIVRAADVNITEDVDIIMTITRESSPTTWLAVN